MIFLFVQGALGGQALSSEEFVHQAIEQNLDIRLARAESQEARAFSKGIRIPSPSVGFTQMKMAGGQMAQGWQVSQTIPFPAKVSNEYVSRQYAFEAKETEALGTQIDVTAQAKLIYFLVWEAQEQDSVLKEKRQVLLKHIRIARSVARSDTFAKIHVLKAESERDIIDNELEAASRVLQERQSLAAQLLDKDPEAFKLEVRNPGLSEPPRIESIDKVPQIKVMSKRLESYKSLEKASRSEWLPDFTVSYAHMEETVRFPENNQIMVGLTLPFVYFWQQSSRSDESSAQRLKAEIYLNKTKRNIQVEKVNLEKALTTIKSQISTLNNKVLPNAYKRRKLFQNIAPRDLSSLQEHLDTYLSIPDLRLQILSLQAKYEQAVAMLSKYKVQKGGSN